MRFQKLIFTMFFLLFGYTHGSQEPNRYSLSSKELEALNARLNKLSSTGKAVANLNAQARGNNDYSLSAHELKKLNQNIDTKTKPRPLHVLEFLRFRWCRLNENALIRVTKEEMRALHASRMSNIIVADKNEDSIAQAKVEWRRLRDEGYIVDGYEMYPDHPNTQHPIPPYTIPSHNFLCKKYIPKAGPAECIIG